MAISPFSARPATPEGEGRRARLVALLVALGIAASLLAYAISPSVRHAVGHAAHSVRHAVSRVFDHDTPAAKHPARLHLISPLHRHTASRGRAHGHTGATLPGSRGASTSAPVGVAAPSG